MILIYSAKPAVQATRRQLVGQYNLDTMIVFEHYYPIYSRDNAKIARFENHESIAIFSMNGSIVIGYLQSLIW
jgi:hypothetical protein